MVVAHIFRNSRVILFIIACMTVYLTYCATSVQVSGDFRKMLPMSHPYLQNFMQHQDEMNLGSSIHLIVKSQSKTIFDDQYLTFVEELTNKVYDLPRVDKSNIKSLWTPNARWIAVTGDGFQGGELIPPDYDGSAESIQGFKTNLNFSKEVGRMVADDFASTVITVPFIWPEASEKVDYGELNSQLENLRAMGQKAGFDIAIVGNAKKIGDLIHGANQMIYYFFLAMGLTFVLIVWYTRSLLVSFLITAAGLCGVLWQLGLISILGRYFAIGLDPYSMLVPFLIFAIAVSHGLQIFNTAALNSTATLPATSANTIKQTTSNHKLANAQVTFKSIIKPASLALMSDALGFAALAIVPIAAIQDLALTASIGVLGLFCTVLLLHPLLIKSLGLNARFVARVQARQTQTSRWAQLILCLIQPKFKIILAIIFVGLSVVGVIGSQYLQIGDLEKGAPELKANSQYNQDIGFYVEHYSQSADVYVVMVETAVDQCNSIKTLSYIEALQFQLADLPGVQFSFSIADGVKQVWQGLNGGYPKWHFIPQNQQSIHATTASLPDGLLNTRCDFTPIYVFLRDHKAATLTQVSTLVDQFNAELNANNTDDAMQFLSAAGNAGIEAAVNDSVAQEQPIILLVIYAIVIGMCLVTFRRFGAALAIILPLALTSLLCQAFMAALGIGVKVSTLPVIALGVGIGVDYGVYIYSKYLETQDLHHNFADRIRYLLNTTGSVVAFTGIALAIGVGTWVFSAIKFQADMGVLLTFMFLWNMVGALLLLPFILSIIESKSKT